MARRANSGLKAGQIIIGLIVLAGLIGGGWFFLNHGSDPHATTPTLDVTEYLERSASLEGNTYKFNGVVQGQLKRDKDMGRLLHVSTKNDDGSFGDPVGVQLPAALDTQNIQKGQEFVFVIEVTSKGMLLVTDLRNI